MGPPKDAAKANNQKSNGTPNGNSKQLSKKPLLLNYTDLPAWQRDNHFIHTSYRPASSSYLHSFLSLTYLHNESVNIYTHLLGALITLFTLPSLTTHIQRAYPTSTLEDVLVLGCFFLGLIACLGMSATYHTISNHSHAVAIKGNKLDYLGIVGLIWGSFIPVLYYAFQDNVALMRTYVTMISTLAVATSVVATQSRFRTPALRPFRAAMFVAMGLSAVVPVLHACRIYGFHTLRRTIGLDWVLLQGALYILGAGLYAARFPECVWPGGFDVWGSSHQIFHVLVLAAAGAHFVGLVKAFGGVHGERVKGGGEVVYLFLGGKGWWGM